MNAGISIGEAFKQWFTQWGITDPDWFYGMIICGDPLLKPLQSVYRPGQFYAKRKLQNSMLYWSTPEAVDQHPETDGFVSTTKDGQGRIWAAWVTGRSVPDGRTEICTAYRTSGAWTSATIVDPYIYWDFFPSMTTNSGGSPVVAWSRCYGRNYDAYISTHNGTSWDTPYRLSSKATDALHPALTVDGDDRLWVTMERWNHLNGDIYCRYYQGASWQSMFAVTVDPDNDYKPSMATDSSGYAWTVWASERYQDNRNIYVKRYNPGLGQWADMYRITSNLSQDQDPRTRHLTDRNP
ncbi:hypothetical protein A2Y85_03175 [candidate division WOR-3 bacterium RBG_13_43_14]|uniref:Sialidase domain-containing protein n=1 Tax=candidate division WOR-3 bacterium RBG_13_43_14 TaxID=1802590 RepID=A0A1F4UCE0_UNCW3|nr:MAG: hypothetical protein A2Y85_03175 [candidate division WOR-3 bacterium RBG_13_43_14]